MELKKLQTQTNWETASDAINHNSDRINESVMRLEHAAIKGKGYFKTSDDLVSAYPAPSVGSWAFVGTEYPFAIWSWNAESASWEDSGATGGDATLSLAEFYTKSEAKALFVQSGSVRTIDTSHTQAEIEEMIENGTADPNTLYIAFEE